MATTFGIILLILVLIFLILPLFIKKNYVIEENVLINKQPLPVFEYVKLLKNQDNYNKWVMADPNVKRVLTGIDGTTGFRLAWDSEVKSVGKGEQEITAVETGKRIASQVRFEKPFKNTALVEMLVSADANSNTRLTWRMKGQNKYPMNIMNLFIPGMLAKDMAESLATLKSVLEK